MKKILYVVNADWAFMVNRLPIAIEALQQGYEVHIGCAFTGRQTELESAGLIVHEIPFTRSGKNPFQEINTIRKIYSLISKVKPDLVHAVTIKPVLYGGIVSKVTGVKAFVAAIAGLGIIFSSNDFKSRLIRTFVQIKYKFALSNPNKKVIFQNPHDKAIVMNMARISERDTLLIKGSGASLEKYVHLPEPDGKIIVSMACRLLKDKGVFEFVEAAKFITANNADVEFWLIGSPDFGSPNSLSEEDIVAINQTKAVKLLGHRDDIYKLFTQSHIVALPSYYGEGLPKVLIEAAACGRPVVTTDNPGCLEAVIKDETGFIVPIRNSESLTKALLKLIEDKALRQRMGDNARKLAEKEFDIKMVVAKHLDVYRELMNK